MDANNAHRKYVANITTALMRKVRCFVWMLLYVGNTSPQKKMGDKMFQNTHKQVFFEVIQLFSNFSLMWESQYNYL